MSWEDERRELQRAADALRRKHRLPIVRRGPRANTEAWDHMDSLIQRLDEAIDGAEVWNRSFAPNKGDVVATRLKRALEILDEAIAHVKQQRGTR